MFWVNILIYFLLAVYVIICVLMVLVILMQRSKNDGIGAAFGGGMMDSAFGPGTSTVLVKSTVGLAVIYFFLTLSLAFLYSYTSSSSAVDRELRAGTPQTEEAEVAGSIGMEEKGEVPTAVEEPAETPEPASGSPLVTEGQEVSDPAPAPETKPEAPAEPAKE